MGTILEFRSADKPSPRNTAPQTEGHRPTGEVVIFPGVRIERPRDLDNAALANRAEG